MKQCFTQLISFKKSSVIKKMLSKHNIKKQHLTGFITKVNINNIILKTVDIKIKHLYRILQSFNKCMTSKT